MLTVRSKNLAFSKLPWASVMLYLGSWYKESKGELWSQTNLSSNDVSTSQVLCDSEQMVPLPDTVPISFTKVRK